MTLLKEMIENIVNERNEDAQINFHSYLTGKMQRINEGSAEKRTPASLIGLKAKDYNDNSGTIVGAAYLKDWQDLEKYDSSGWMNDGMFDEDLEGYDKNTAILVAFEDSDDINVFIFDGSGVTI